MVGAGEGVVGLSRKERGLMDTDSSVVIAGKVESIRGLNGNEKNTIKIVLNILRAKVKRERVLIIYASLFL